MTEIPFTPCPELCTIIPLNLLRKTPGVTFDSIPEELVQRASGAERVLHQKGAQSPGAVGAVTRPWYCHKTQHDNLMVLFGSRSVELYHPSCARIFTFDVTPESIRCDCKTRGVRRALLSPKPGVAHRIIASPDAGSASFNFAVRDADFDIRHEFDIWDLDEETGKAVVIREGWRDQQ